MSAIRVIKGEYRNRPVRNIAFNLVSGFQTGAKGNFVTVFGRKIFVKCDGSHWEIVGAEKSKSNTLVVLDQ